MKDNILQEVKILVIDDDKSIHQGFEVLFEDYGAKLFSALTGKEGIELAKQLKPDLVILDISLPDIKGWEVCRLLKSDTETKDIPIIMLTGVNLTPEEEVRGLELGAEDYIQKMPDIYKRVRIKGKENIVPQLPAKK